MNVPKYCIKNSSTCDHSKVWTTKSIILIGLFILNLVTLSISGRDFYSILNVPKDSNLDTIKKSYRKLAKEFHPDKNKKDPEAEDKFQDITTAYEVLSDPDKRKTYDRHGEEGLKHLNSGGGHDPFASFFGNFGGFGFGGHDDHGEREIPRGNDVIMDKFVTLEQLYTGTVLKVIHNKQVFKPASGTRKCRCRQEMITRQLGPGRFQMLQQNVCDECPNHILVNEESILSLEIEQGMTDGQGQKFFAEGEPYHDGGEPGDLMIRIKTSPHPVFERRGDDLYTNMTIGLLDALIGFETELKHLDGHKVIVKRNKITWPGARMRKPNEGMPNYENNNLKGILFITFDIEFPKGELNDKQKELVQKLFHTSDSSTSYTIKNPEPYNGLRGY